MYEEFVKHFVETTKAYKLGDPTKPETNLGPVVSLASAERIRKQVKDAGELFDIIRMKLAHVSRGGRGIVGRRIGVPGGQGGHDCRGPAGLGQR